MTVRELIDQLEGLDDDMEIVIGIRQIYGSNFAMEIENCLEEYNVTSFENDNCRAVVITEGKQIGIVNYEVDD